MKTTRLIALAVLMAGLIGFPVLFPEQTYALMLMTFMGIYIIAVSGLDILFGYSGQISLGHAAFYAIGAYTSTLLSMHLKLPVVLTMLIGASLATIVGMIIAYPASKLVAHFLSLSTIAFGELVYLFIVHSPGDITLGFSGIGNIPALTLFGFRFNTTDRFYFVVLFFVLLFLLMKARIVRSRVGRCFIAIRDNSLAANGMGINVRKYKVMAFGISAFFTGFAGTLYAHSVRFISPESFMNDQSVVFLTIALFGGVGTLAGPVIGSVVVTVIRELLQKTGNYQMIIYGAFLVAVLLFMPKGVMHWISNTRIFKAVRENAKDGKPDTPLRRPHSGQ